MSNPDSGSIPPGRPPAPERPIGEPTDFTGAELPVQEVLSGRYVTLRPVDPEGDAGPLFRISHLPDGDPDIWWYLPYGPFADVDAFHAVLADHAASGDPLFFTVCVDGVAQGIVSYLNVVPDHGSIELGHIWFGPALQRTPAATEAIFLLARRAFDDLGYRRLEWKCNSLNGPSRRAAGRFGFLYEGTFAQHQVVKGRNRDTAWFAITDGRWPEISTAFEMWLDPANFDAEGHQRASLRSLRAA